MYINCSLHDKGKLTHKKKGRQGHEGIAKLKKKLLTKIIKNSKTDYNSYVGI